jgi:hypothetical protein
LLSLHVQTLPVPHGCIMGPLQKQSQLSVVQLSGNGRHMRISGSPEISGKVRTQYWRSATHMSEPHENETVCDPPDPPRAPLLPPLELPLVEGVPPLPEIAPPSPAPAAPPDGEPAEPPLGVPPAPPLGAPPAPLPA